MPSSLELGIVTAFFDIGRSNWTTDQNHPAHLARTTDIYFDRFEAMAALDNELVVYTSPDLAERVREMRRGKEDRTTIVPYDLTNAFPERRAAIRRIQTDPAFIAQINPSQIGNPEYWSVDYILVTNLKTFFTAHAVTKNLLRAPMVAWLDFGLFRNKDALQGKTKWEYPFTSDKAHLLSFSPYNNEFSIPQIVAHNIAYIAGGLIAAPQSLWPQIAELATGAIQMLNQHHLVDDDQTIMLLAYLQKREMFELHQIGPNDWERIMDLLHV